MDRCSFRDVEFGLGIRVEAISTGELVSDHLFPTRPRPVLFQRIKLLTGLMHTTGDNLVRKPEKLTSAKPVAGLYQDTVLLGETRNHDIDI